MSDGRPAEVEARLQGLLQHYPKAGPLWKLYAGAKWSQDKDALAAWHQAATLLPSDVECLFQFGNALLDRGEFGRAAEYLQQAIALKADFAEAHDSLGSARLALGNPADAATSHREALKLRPTFAEAHGNLGNALVSLGKLEEAIFHYRRMLEFRPTMAEAHNNLGNALLALKRYEEAQATYRRTVELRPDAPGAHANLGNALRELGRTDEALKHCRKAVELAPNDADAHRLLGNSFFDLGNMGEAVASYRRAIELEPTSADALTALSKVLRQTGRVTAAAEQCIQALTIKPDHAEALTLLGELQADNGRFAQAEALFAQATAIAPDLPDACAAVTRYRKMSISDGAWLESAERLLSKPLAIGEEILLRNAVGKYHDDLQNFDLAFESYRRANDLKKRTGNKHDQRRVSLRVDEISRRYDAKWFVRAAGAGIDSHRPIFVVGMPRSGTTLVEQILASHPAVFGAGELRYWHTAVAKYEASSRTGSVDAGAIASVATEYLKQLTEMSDATNVIDKMPANFMNLGLIHAALPAARIIHLQRNPIDTGLSIYFQTFSGTHTYANDLDDVAHYYAQYLRLMAHWEQTPVRAAILNISYEQLIEAPEAAIREVLAFVGLPWDERCLNFHETDRTVVTASNWQVRQKISKSSAGRWRNYERHLGPLRALLESEAK
jgi:tetratricopeptide (TPR) repeat protein